MSRLYVCVWWPYFLDTFIQMCDLIKSIVINCDGIFNNNKNLWDVIKKISSV